MPEELPMTASGGPKVDDEHPWLGLRPFTEENQHYFFGRTVEIRWKPDSELLPIRGRGFIRFGERGTGNWEPGGYA